MCHAVFMMRRALEDCEDVRKLSKMYAVAREEIVGKPRPDDVRKKISATLIGHAVSEESKEKNRQKHIGRKYPNRKRLSDEDRKKMSER